jgi:hypothetical protein
LLQNEFLLGNGYSLIDVDIYLSFHEILTWQVPADIELVNMSTQKISLLHTKKKTMQHQINSQNNMLVLIENNKTTQ